MSRKDKFGLLVKSYVIGIALTIVIAFLQIFTTFNIPAILILIVGIVHLSWLIILGYGLGDQPYLLIGAGNRIQSAGYLHTLIGFITALSLLQQDKFEIAQFAVPISSALITSLMGWLFGGEITAKGETDKPELEKATSQIVNALQEYYLNIEKIQEQHLDLYKTNLVNMEKAYNTSLEQVENTYKSHLDKLEQAHKEHANKLLGLYQKHNQNLDTLYINLEKNSNAIKEAFGKVENELSQGAARVSGEFRLVEIQLNKGAEEIKQSFGKVKSTVDGQTQSLNNSLQNYNTASSGVGRSAENLSNKFQELQQNGVKASDEIKKVAKSAQSASKEMQKWASETTNSVGLVNQLITELQKLAKYISAQRGNNP